MSAALIDQLIKVLEEFTKFATALGVLYAIYQGRKIHTLVNSNFTKVSADLTIANQRIEALQTALLKNGKVDPTSV
jgi:hypothetical protein